MLVSAVMKPVYARVSDMTSRPTALASGLFFFTIGYIVVAASQSVKDLAGGEVLYTVGNTGMSFGELRICSIRCISQTDRLAKSLIVADITNLQNRGLVQGLMTSPFIPNGFIAGFITHGIGGLRGEGWRWGVSPP
jgi:MFS family permease